MSRTESVVSPETQKKVWDPPKRWCYQRLPKETRGSFFFYLSPASKKLRQRLERAGKRVPFSIRW